MIAGVNEQEAEGYRKAWRDYRRRRNFIAVIFIGFIPWGFLVLKFIPKRDRQGILLARRHCVLRATEMPPMW